MTGASRTLSKGRLVLFSVLTTVLVLGAVNAVIEHLGRTGRLDLHRPDDGVQFVEEDLLEHGPDDTWTTTAYARELMLPSSFARTKGDGWRMFVLGGSFSLGSPYSHQEDGRETPGGISSFLRARLQARFPDRTMEVVNLGAGGEGSQRVRRITEEVLPYEPDALFVATCNNEGASPPSAMREYLHTLGGYRLMTQLLAPSEDLTGRELHTVQESQVKDLRDQFRDNLESIAQQTAAARVPLLLATLPTNLRYQGWSMSPFADGADITLQVTREEESPCVAKGKQAFEEGRWSEAIEALSTCEDVGEALRWIGLSMIELGRVQQGKALLEQSVELLPRNRCRPSFNLAIRQVAAAHPHIVLVDLQGAAERAAQDGIPGHDLFLDFCHLNWRGYAAMALEIETALLRSGLIEQGQTPPSIDELAERFGMAGIEQMDRVRSARWD